MGFLKDFKDDFSQAVDELMPGEDSLENAKNVEVNTLDSDVDVAAELSKIDDLLGKVANQLDAKAVEPEVKVENTEKKSEPEKRFDKNDKYNKSFKFDKKEEKKEEVKKEEVKKEEAKIEEKPKVAEEKVMVENTTPEKKELPPAVDETSVITKGMIIKGDILTNGSLDIQGEVYGNVDCSGKLVVTGTVKGNSNAAEVFADAARIEGEVSSTGTIKIGLGSVIIGNVSSTSAVVAGAIKGDIDVQGPVVVDTSAVVKGNIKSRSVQINNGAVIDGFCSQTYADIDMDKLFGTKEGK